MRQVRPNTSTPVITPSRTDSAAYYKDKISDHKIQSAKYYVKKMDPDNKQLMSGYLTQTMKRLLKDAPNSREFKKTIPKHIPQDQERLYEELNNQKQLVNQLQLQNYQLKVQVKNQESIILKQFPDEEDKMLKERLESSLQLPFFIAHKSETQHPQSFVIQLRRQVKDLLDELETQKEDMLRLKRNAKLTKIQETQAELSAFRDECSRLKKQLHQALLETKSPNKQKKDIVDQYLEQQELVQTLHNNNSHLSNKIVNLQEQLKIQNNKYEELEVNYNKALKEKINLKKELQDLEEQFNKATLNDPQFKRGQDVTYLKLEFEKKLLECSQLRNDAMLKDKKINDVQKQLKSVSQIFQEKLNNVTKEREMYKEKSEKQRNELVELQDKYQQLFFNSNRNMMAQSTKEIKYTQQSMDEVSPFAANYAKSKFNMEEDSVIKVSLDEPQVKASSFNRKFQKTLSAIKLDEVQGIFTQIRYKLRGQNVSATELDNYFNHEKNTMSISEMIQFLQRKPFELNQNESVSVARFLIETYDEKGIQYNLALSMNTHEISAQFIKHIGQYKIFIGEEKVKIHEQIRQTLNAKKQQIMAIIKPRRASNPGASAPNNLVLRSLVNSALVENNFEAEQIDIIFQTLFEVTQDFNFIDIEALWQIWPATGKLRMVKGSEGDIPVIVHDCLEQLLDYMNDNNLSILDIRKQLDPYNQGYVTHEEMREFLESCQIQIDRMKLMLVIDNFDMENDGKIRMNEFGDTLREQQKRSMSPTADKKRNTPKQLVHMIASHFVDYMNQNKVDLFQIFMSIDQDGQGSITRDEFKQMLRTKVIIPLDQNEFTEFFKMLDKTGDGQIVFQEFQHVMIPEIEKITGKAYTELFSEQQKAQL